MIHRLHKSTKINLLYNVKFKKKSTGYIFLNNYTMQVIYVCIRLNIFSPSYLT